MVVELAGVTRSTTTVGKIRKRERTVVVHGVLGPEVLAWAVGDDGSAPGAIVTRRARVDVFEGSGLSPQLVALAGEVDDDGVSIRGDLGHREISTYFMGLGTGPDAERVRAALLGYKVRSGSMPDWRRMASRSMPPAAMASRWSMVAFDACSSISQRSGRAAS